MENEIDKIRQMIIDTYVDYNDSLKRAEIKKEELDNLKERLKNITKEIKNKNV